MAEKQRDPKKHEPIPHRFWIFEPYPRAWWATREFRDWLERSNPPITGAEQEKLR